MTDLNEKIISFAVKYRMFSAIFILLFTIFFGYNLKNITVDNNAAHAVPDTLKQMCDMEKLREKFNSPYSILLMTQFDEDKNIPLHEKIEIFSSWAQKFLDIEVDGVKGFESAAHIATLKAPMMGMMGGVRTIPIAGQKNDETLRKIINENFALTGNFISRDEKTFLMILYTNDNANADRPKTITEAMKVLDEIHEEGYKNTYITGATATSWYMSHDMNRDLVVLLPISLLIAAALLFWMFRSVRCVVAPLLLVGIAIVWTFGIMALVKIPLNVLTSIIPLIILPVGLAGSLHIIKSYRQNRRETPSFESALIKTYKELLGPIFIAGVTTFFGFSSFSVSSLSWTRYFGFFTGIGVVISLFLSVFFLPVCFSTFEKKDDSIDREPKNLIPMSFFNFMIFKTPLAKILLICVIIFSIIFVPKINFDSNPISFFDRKHDVRKSDEIIGEQFGGTRFFDILIESETPFADSASWQNLQDIVDWIKKENPEVGSVTSVFPVLNRVSNILKGTPISQTAVSAMLSGSATKNESGADILDAFVTRDRKTVKFTLICKNIPLYNYMSLEQRIEKYILETYPEYKVVASGEALLIDSMIELLIKTQTWSLLITFLLIAVSLVILFRSFVIGLFSTLPIVTGACFIAGVMAAFGITINMVTVIVVNCCIGIGIDYAIHFSSSFLRFRKNGAETTEALLNALQDKSTVIVFNTLAVGVGFLVLCLSNFPPVRTLGFFIFLSMTVGSVFSLLFLPLFLNLKRRGR
ncbi:MAG: MMPL family transporter [Chitinivibrionia bacterium]|nr:MMPL family transporter [Chitinivibrionia bacterium]